MHACLAHACGTRVSSGHQGASAICTRGGGYRSARSISRKRAQGCASRDQRISLAYGSLIFFSKKRKPRAGETRGLFSAGVAHSCLMNQRRRPAINTQMTAMTPKSQNPTSLIPGIPSPLVAICSNLSAKRAATKAASRISRTCATRLTYVMVQFSCGVQLN